MERYNAKVVEEKWLRAWSDDMYEFDWSRKPYFIIDTPPPYPTGSFHLGNALNWCYIDFIARYKRMKGYNVMFPQGWDCHGLPTEVKVEEMYGISKNDVPREEFRRMCAEFTMRNIEKMRSMMKRLGFSIDWSKEYITMLPEYYKKTQMSFVRMYEKGLIYRDCHPVVFCPRCQTTIALAEIEYRKGKTKLNYILFDEDVEIATTRPELIPACVAIAVHPRDGRYRHLVGRRVKVPIFNYEVPIVEDEEVDPNFGTGIVMICTFGDRQDVRWWKKHNLPLRSVLRKDGRLNELAGRYEGLTLREARERILKDLEREGRLIGQEDVDQNVGVCWRCKTPVEIVVEDQWFVKVDKERVIEGAKRIRWIPEHMLQRLIDWVESMEWDWVISRQRIFATPIPVWRCKRCGEIVVAREDWLPVDPTKDKPKEPCPKCGGMDFEGESDVLDTWMDSSITPLIVCGWPNLKTYPTNLRPQGHDIIRTWAFYTILRSLALIDEIPWSEIVINGMVLGEDGRKMSKSLGNVISPDEIVESYGADALRQWAASGVVGEDVAFSWKEIKSAYRFQHKFWSILRFVTLHLKEIPECKNLRDADRWILSKLMKLVRDVDRYMESYRFDMALKAIRSFAWYEFADNYIEIVKNRLYSGSEDERVPAKFTLYKVMEVLIRLLAPITPFLAEECWHRLHDSMGVEVGSVHLQSYPKVEEFIDEEAERRGELIKEIVIAVRRFKHERGMSLNAPLKSVRIYVPIYVDTRDIAGALNSNVELLSEIPDIEVRVRRMKPKFGIIGPMFKEKARDVVRAVENLSDEDKLKLFEGGSVVISLDGKEVEVKGEWFEVEMEKVVKGEDVEVLETKNAIVLVEV